MLIRIKNKIECYIKDSLSWRSVRKLLVIESDDWGTVRMSTPQGYRNLLAAGIPVDRIHYSKYDALESEEDLSLLFETLSRYKDKSQRPAVFTANCLMANPDFDRIRADHFEHYYYQPVQETFASYPKHENSFNLWMEGYKNKIFHPQFHGREHVNIGRWMQALRDNLPETRLAFDNGVFGISMHGSTEERGSYLEALAAGTNKQAEEIHESVVDGLQLFRKTMGYSSKSFIAPNYSWSTDLERTLFKQGVQYIQGNRMQTESLLGTGSKVKRKVHYTGKKNTLGQTYLVRNCHFEPSSDPNKDWVNHCLKQVSDAFRMNKPAIICSHRVNYMGTLDEENRGKNLKSLEQLLRRILVRWPDVEFMSSDELGTLIDKKS